ncbi:hypothetical protein VTJ04DRAFT_8703 [Mycothermus thermophilus]|uniref:uncharacterized protein n=1 Tax=Humicola insolens TaxID=85995 RepID=UPI003744937E
MQVSRSLMFEGRRFRGYPPCTVGHKLCAEVGTRCNANHCRGLTGANLTGTLRPLSPLNGCVAFPIDRELRADNTPTSPRGNSMFPRPVRTPYPSNQQIRG